MLLSNLIDRGSLPVLQRVMSFTEARHEVLASNVSNFDTVDHKATDLAVNEFMGELDKAISRRDSKGAGASFEMNPTKNIKYDASGRLQARRVELSDSNILFHDGNNRSVEKRMSEMSKNALLHNVAGELLRQQYSMLRMAISGRI